jgi:hypothetical protein
MKGLKTKFVLDKISKYKSCLIEHDDRMQINRQKYRRSLNQIDEGIFEETAGRMRPEWAKWPMMME